MENINISNPNDGLGDKVRDAFNKVNLNFTELDNGKEVKLLASDSTKYYRGDKSWQTLDKTAVGLNLVDNTADSNKPVSIPQQNALATKAPLAHTHTVSQITDFPTFKTIENQSIIGAGNIDLDKASVGLGNVDNTSDLSKPLSTATINALATKAPISSVHNQVTLGTANGLSLSNQQLSLGLASSGVTGALSGTDWNTFNSKQNALTNPVIGTGTSGQVAFWNGTNTQTGDNGLFWDNTNKRLGIDTNIPSAKFTLGSVAQEEVSYGFITPTTNWGKISSYLSFKSQEPVDGDTNFSIKLWKGSFSPDYGQALTRFFINGANGNVGIGTTTPNAKLEVIGSITSIMVDSYPTIGVLNSGTVGFPLLQLKNVKNGVEKAWNIENGRTVNGDLGFYNLGGERVTIKDNGRVLINKTNDDLTNQLQVAGTISATSYTATSLPVFENNASASSLAVGQFYRTSTGVLMVKF